VVLSLTHSYFAVVVASFIVHLLSRKTPRFVLPLPLHPLIFPLSPEIRIRITQTKTGKSIAVKSQITNPNHINATGKRGLVSQATSREGCIAEAKTIHTHPSPGQTYRATPQRIDLRISTPHFTLSSPLRSLVYSYAYTTFIASPPLIIERTVYSLCASKLRCRISRTGTGTESQRRVR